MGQPIGLLPAGVLLAKRKRSSIQNTSYVHDTFIMRDSTTNIRELLDIFNNNHPSINSTAEIEKDDTFGFWKMGISEV